MLVGYDAFRGVSDDSWENNGIHSGANLGTRLGPISEWTGIGFQVGGTAGVYDWSGTDYRPRSTDSQMQGFLTYGLFRRPDENCAVTGAIVQDWMFNDNYGVFSQNPTLSQWRGQLGYALNWRHELGMWGTWRGRSDTRDVAGIGPTKWQAVNQLMAYWHYKFRPGGADTWIWLGAPDHSRLSGGGSLGSWIASAGHCSAVRLRWPLHARHLHESVGRGRGVGLGRRDVELHRRAGVLPASSVTFEHGGRPVLDALNARGE